MPARPGRLLLVAALGLLWQLGLGAPAARATDGSEHVAGPASRNVLLLHMSPRGSPGLLALENAFRKTLTGAGLGQVSFYSEYFELTPLEDDRRLQAEVADYLRAKYGRLKLDLVAVTSSRGLRFVVRHRDRLFPGVPVVFGAVDQTAATDVVIGRDISGVWLSSDWAGTLESALWLQPQTEGVLVITGASGFGPAARSQLEGLGRPVAIDYLIAPTMEDALTRVAGLPDGTIVLLGPFGRDATGRDFRAPEVGARLAKASTVPVYTVIDTNVGSGVVGGRVMSFEAHGVRQAEVGARLLRGERPAADETGTNVYRFDARQLRRWGLDARRLPPDSAVLFDEPSAWQLYGGYVVAAVILLALQSWLIVGLLASRSQRRRAQAALAEQLGFETLVSTVLTALIRAPGSGESSVEPALALIGAGLELDQVLLAERNEKRRAADITHAWVREGIGALPPSLEWSAYPWISRRLRENQVVSVTPSRPLPPEAEADRQSMLAMGLRSLLVVPLILDGTVEGFLSVATLRAEREWPDGLIERCRLLAEVLANTMARRRAEAMVLAGEERYRQQREELAHALRVNTLGEFGVSLAHEINQPLTAIALNARAMARLLEGGAFERVAVAEALTDINADAMRAGAIIARLRALSRREHSPKTGLDLDALIDDVADLMRPDLALKRITVHRASTLRLPPVSGDPIQLQQVFLNLLTNSSEAIGRGDGAERRITVVSSHPAP
ncbi:MAG TPA: GAF domain-containing protein, partial [Methylomirabilota bacterium]|nr:GAF domain-containing protein [Methylomirabilota bacterium]